MTNLGRKRKRLSNLLFPEKSNGLYHSTYKNDIAGYARNLFFTFVLFCITACNDPSIYHLYQPVENAVWQKEKAYYFSFEIKDTSIPYDLTLDLRNNTLYPYRNIWIVYKEEQPIGPLVQDTMECILADEYNKWKGNGFSLFTNNFPVKKNFHFPHTGLYTFSFSHIMTDEKLKGVHEIGFRIEKTQPDSPSR